MEPPAVTVITSSTGNPALERCIRSVASQTAQCMHVIVADGSAFHEPVCTIVSRLRAKGVLMHDNHRLLQLPFNTGANGMGGHRVYAALPWLVTTEWVAFLDEDNWYDDSHICDMLQAACNKAEWVHSLRRICADDGTVLVEDNCESLGLLHPSFNSQQHFCDTSTLMLRRQLACELSPLWNIRVVADRQLSARLVKAHRGATSLHHSLNYTVGDGHMCSTSGQMFREGNAIVGRTWTRPPLYIFHFTPELTRHVLAECVGRADRCAAFDEWQVTQYDGLSSEYLLLDGFALEPSIPAGSHVYMNWVCPQTHLPWATLKRSDIYKHTYLVESPNSMHTRQWDDALLGMFTTVFTFWRPTLPKTSRLPMCRFARMNTHFLDLGNAAHRGQLVTNLVDDRSVCMVLMNRRSHGPFVVRNTLLQRQEHLRQFYMKDLRHATVFGIGWDASELGPGVRVGHVLGKVADPRSSVAIMQHFTFAVVIENVDADGYVSEKLYDCLVAGCIPVYYGNNNELVGVPEDLYIDLKQFATSAQLQQHLDTVDVAAFKQRIIDKREAVLRGVGTAYFAGLIGSSNNSGNIFLVQDWQAVEYGLPYARVGTARDGHIASTLASLGPDARVLAVHHVLDIERALESMQCFFGAKFKRVRQCENTFEAASIAELVRQFYRQVHYASE
ncbi:hypothetical protein OEZ85_011012 [Tetradesmus obliquus]|uniref:Fucosyltransferase n=1 Tax=Tetradesmus obliquus TaxID=3088 RepID=A0ABY8TSV5_TETOB|nr:hypothetical protein OEZ85_011012 [Tetradesmus obliquus]